MFSITTERALRALSHMAQRPEGTSVLGRDIAQTAMIPANYLSKILLALRNARLIATTRGSGGGYRLLRPACEIALIDVVSLFDKGSAAPQCLIGGGRPCAEDHPCAAHEDWKGVRETYMRFLENTTLERISRRASGSGARGRGSRGDATPKRSRTAKAAGRAKASRTDGASGTSRTSASSRTSVTSRSSGASGTPDRPRPSSTRPGGRGGAHPLGTGDSEACGPERSSAPRLGPGHPPSPAAEPRRRGNGPRARTRPRRSFGCLAAPGRGWPRWRWAFCSSVRGPRALRKPLNTSAPTA